MGVPFGVPAIGDTVKFPVVIGTASGTASVTANVNVTVPAGVLAGDTLVAVYMDTAGGGSYNVPTGFALVSNIAAASNPNIGTNRMFTKTAVGTESGTNVAFSRSFAGDARGFVYVVRGAGTVLAATPAWGAASATFTPPALTGVATKYLVISGGARTGGAQSISGVPAGAINDSAGFGNGGFGLMRQDLIGPALAPGTITSPQNYARNWAMGTVALAGI